MTILTSATIPLKNKSLLQQSNNILNPFSFTESHDNFSFHTVKKDSDFLVPSRDVTKQTFPGRE